MKAILTLFTSLAIGAGVIVGYLDFRAGKDAGKDDGAVTGTNVTSGTGETSPLEKARRVDSSPGPTEEGGRAVRPGEAAQQQASTGSLDDVPSLDVDPDLERRADEIRNLLAEGEFDKAVSAGQTLLEESRAPAGQLTDVARLVARGRVFGRFSEALPEPAELAGLAEVQLANGNTVRAKKVEREGDRYVIHLARGGSFVPEKNDVLEVRPVDPETHRRKEWAALEPKLGRLEDPLDLYLDGVQRCHELGLQEECFRILERILLMDSEQAEQIPLLFVPDADRDLLRDWRVAAGRESPVLPTATLAASGNPPPPPESADPDREGAPPRLEPGSSVPEPAYPGTGGGPARSLDPAELVRAAQLVAEAQILYRGAARQEGKEEDLGEARNRLNQALGILESQPPDEDSVKRLRRQVATLLSDVARASPF